MKSPMSDMVAATLRKNDNPTNDSRRKRGMKTIEEIKEYLLKNRVDVNGDLDLEDLDFSDFEGNVTISGMKVRGDLYQCWQTVQGNLNQDSQDVKGDLYQSRQTVQGDLHQSLQTVLGDLNNCYNEYGGELIEFPSIKTRKEITHEELFRMGYKIKPAGGKK